LSRKSAANTRLTPQTRPKDIAKAPVLRRKSVHKHAKYRKDAPFNKQKNVTILKEDFGMQTTHHVEFATLPRDKPTHLAGYLLTYLLTWLVTYLLSYLVTYLLG